MAFKTEAIVLHQRYLTGADRIYEVLSPEYGKLQLVARSVARSSSKMAGHMEDFSHVWLMIGRGRQDHLAGVKTIKNNRELRESWFNFILTSSLVELVLTVNVSGESAREEFALLQQTFSVLSDPNRSRQERVSIARIFLWKLLSLSGWKPDLERCAVSRESLAGNPVFYQSPKGFVRKAHNRDGIPVDRSLMEFLEHIISVDDWNDLIARANQNGFTKEWLQVSQLYYQDIVSKPLQSLKLFQYV